MKKILFLYCILTFPAAAARAADKDAAAVLKTNTLCEDRTQVKADGPVDMKAGFDDYCSVFLEIDAELLVREKLSERIKIKAGRSAMAMLIAKGDTPSVTDAQKLCGKRLPAGYTPPSAGPYAGPARGMSNGCRLLDRAKKVSEQQRKMSPRPPEYYENIAAIRVSAASIVTAEETWLLTSKAAESKTRPK
jgi:hypothetical protein